MSSRTRASSPGAGGRGDYVYLVEADPADPTSATVYNNIGTVVHGPSASITEINWALANLTAGRTNKERVVVKGNFTLIGTILVPSYAILDLSQANLFLANGANVNMIQNADQVAGNTQVEVIGGYLNGNRVDQAANSDGINFVNVTNFLIRYVHTYDFYRNGMRLQDCISGRVAGCLVDYSYQDGLVILGGSTHLTIIGNEVRLSRNGVGADGVGIFIVLGMRNEIIGNNVHENMNGIEVRGFENTITGNDCHLNYGCGIVIASNLNPGNVVTGNQVHGNGLDGIRVMIQQTVITGNAVRDNSYTGAGGTLNTRDGIHVEADACVVVGNSAVNSDATFHQRHGIFVSGNSCVVEGNDCRYNRTDGIHAETGDRILISGNTCENNANYGIKIDADADYCRVEGNITTANTTGSVHVANANCDNTVITNNNLDENVITDVGTNTRAWLNYDPSANAFVATINAPTVVGGGGGALP